MGLTVIGSRLAATSWVMPVINRIAVGVLVTLTVATAAVFTTRVLPETIQSWDSYVARVEQSLGAGRPMLDVANGEIALTDLNPNGGNGGHDVPGGYIHDWIGAVVIPDAKVARVQAVLEDYANYKTVYAQDVKASSARRMDDGTKDPTYDVRLVTEQVENLGIHFAFEIHSNVQYRHAGGELLVDSRSYLIRESDSGRAPYTDLLPEGNDHGILWRLNSYWRVRQAGTGVYAECRVVSLSRKPLFGMRDQIKSRARASLERTMQATRDAAR